MALDEAIDELYSVSPDEFVATRSRLSKELKEGGENAEAATLAKMRKPSLAAWALNQLSRLHRRDVDLLLDAGHRLRDAQAAVLGGGDRAAFRRAQSAERDAVARLARAAETLLGERGSVSASVLSQVADSLHIAAVAPEGRELLALGRFTTPPASQGFDLANELAAQTPRSARPKRAPATANKDDRVAREALREANEKLRAAEKAVREAKREAERLSREADAARARVAAAEERATAARAEVEAATKRRRT